jgi:hypothetical protein
MANITDSDYGTERTVETEDGPQVLVSQGFPVIVMVRNQHDARKIKAEFRGRGYRAEYDNPVWMAKDQADALAAFIAAKQDVTDEAEAIVNGEGVAD